MMDGKRLPRQAYESILTRVRGKLAGWMAKSLYFTGKITLIKTVLQSIPSYVMSNGWVPKSILDSLEKEFRAFLWNGGESGRYLSLIQWEKLCLGTKEGGLGLRKMASLHKAFMAKLLVRASFQIAAFGLDKSAKRTI